MRALIVTLLSFLAFGRTALLAADKVPTEADYYPITPFTIPEGVVLEAGGIELLPDGKLAVSTRRGDIYLVDKPFSTTGRDAKFTKFAEGLHEVLGIAFRDGWLYATQRPEVTRLRDEDGDGRADRIETVSDGWGINGDYHEYAFGSRFDKDGNIWVVLCLTGSFSSESKYRGWCLRITPDGRVIPTTSGIRSPGGIGFNHVGDVFYTDNQGPWNGACALKHLIPGKFVGHPGGFKWYDLPEVKAVLGSKPREPESGSRMMVEAKKIPELEPPACYFPYSKMGKSASGIVCDTTGKFGPFTNQLFVGDQSDSTVMRVALEKVKGHYQGACFPFRGGIGSGSLSMLMTPNGSMFVGGTNRGWGSRGNKPYSLDRIDWSGKIPFEIHEMRAQPDGFVLTFTQPVDAATAGDVNSYKLSTYTYIYQASYGSPEVDQTTPTIESALVAADHKSVRLKIDKLQEGHIHELHCDGVKSADGLPLLHKQAYYTLNYLPD
jgi:glucose/arabinose dehydrogenase